MYGCGRVFWGWAAIGCELDLEYDETVSGGKYRHPKINGSSRFVHREEILDGYFSKCFPGDLNSGYRGDRVARDFVAELAELV